MKEIYSWVPWFRKLAKKIETGGEKYLIKRARQVKWGSNSSLLDYGDENIDPFSFFYFLAQKNTVNQRKPVYSSVNEVFAISNGPPRTGWGDASTIPKPAPRIPALFHDGENFDPASLWELFRQAVDDKPDVKAKTFREALDIPKVGVAKLTQCLFLINPDCFIPVDHHSKLVIDRSGQYSDDQLEKEVNRLFNIIESKNGFAKYEEELENAKQTFPGCRFYEIVYAYRLLLGLSKEPDGFEPNYYQIGTKANGKEGEDYWSDFEENNWVYLGGPGGKRPFRVKDPKPGDIILVRTGAYQGRAIGIVEKNDYADKGYYEDGKIHVLWINKAKEQRLDRSLGINLIAFSGARADGVCQIFRDAEGYKPTFEFIDNLTEHSTEEGAASSLINQKQKTDTVKHPLNQILYGPPGTGKTWNTVNHAWAIIERKPVDDYQKDDKAREGIKERFDELKKAGQIEMVTFHQNYTYEDFIEGIRPVLSEKTEDGEQGDKGDIKYELSEGILKRIANQAEGDSENKYVLIIDEINRGNIAKIFGELITLIEKSKRLGNDDAATTVLPYSQEPFGVPNNLYIIGTMNTADRSIALLDTALRRRFDFVEMMPDPKHSSINTDIKGVNCQELLEKINECIRFLHDRDHQIGHTYFLNVTDMDSLVETFKNRIIPLLQEYFYDNWEKIDLVLNKNGFIVEDKASKNLDKNIRDFVDTDRKIYRLESDNGIWENPDSYKVIYQPPEQSSPKEQEDQNG